MNNTKTDYKNISRNYQVRSSNMQEDGKSDTVKQSDMQEDDKSMVTKQQCCDQLSALINYPHTKTATLELVKALLAFKQKQHSSKSIEETQRSRYNINDAHSGISWRGNDLSIPKIDDLLVLITNRSFFIQRNLPTTFKNFIQKLINDRTLSIEKTDKLYTFLIDSGVEFTPLLKDYNDLSRGVVRITSSGYTEGCANIVCDHLSELIKNPASKGAAIQLVNALLLFKQERNSSKSTKEIQEELLYNINEARNALVQTVDDALAKEVPSFFQLCTLIKNNDYFIQKNLPTTFKKFIERLITTNILNINDNPKLKQFLINSGVNFNYSLKIYNDISRDEVTIASTPYKDIWRFEIFANKYKKGFSDKQKVCDQLFALITDPNSATKEATFKLVEALLEFKQKRHSSKSVDNTEDKLFDNIKICWESVNDIQKAQGKKILLLPDLLVLIKNSSSLIQRNLPTTFKNFIQKLINKNIVIIEKSDTYYQFLIDSGVKV